MIDYIGDISKQDAGVLAIHATQSKKILEFGCGASTQVIAHFAPADAQFISIDTDQRWITRTVENLQRLNITRDILFIPMPNIREAEKSFGTEFDFIFVDGVNKDRASFALRTWKHLSIGGIMAFHDTRRERDFGYVLTLMSRFQNEISFVNCNANGSNITTVMKKKLEPYINWNIVEGRPAWKVGSLSIPPPSI